MPKITVKNPDKIYFPGSKITKLQVIEYYHKIAPIMLKYCKNRPVSMERYPGDSNTKKLFFQKNIPIYFPDWVKRVKVLNKSVNKSKQKFTTYVLCQNRSSLLYLANQACITLHLWLSTIRNLEQPDVLIFDLDPGNKLALNHSSNNTSKNTNGNNKHSIGGKQSGKLKIDFGPVKLAALALKEILENKYGLTAFVMTTGSRGLHVRVPIKPTVEFDYVREFARLIAEQVVTQYPDKMTMEARKHKRKNRLLIDVMRNSYGATAVAPYAIRARSNAPVATPLDWAELKNQNLNSQKYNIKNIFKRIKLKGDLWHDMDQQAISLKNLI